MAQQTINDFLYSLYDELMAEGAWCGHCYGFEAMNGYYEKLISFMEEHNIPTGELKSSYKKATQEYAKLAGSNQKSFCRREDIRELIKLDRRFLDSVAASAVLLRECVNGGSK